MDLPIISEFVQYGVIGICFALIVAICYVVSLFVGAIKGFYAEVSKLNSTIMELSVEVKTFSRGRRKPVSKESPTDG